MAKILLVAALVLLVLAIMESITIPRPGGTAPMSLHDDGAVSLSRDRTETRRDQARERPSR